MSDFGPEVKQLLDKITSIDKNRYIAALNDLAEDPAVGHCLTQQSVNHYHELIRLMPVSLCSLDYHVSVDTDDGTVNLCFETRTTQYVTYISSDNNYQCVIWKQDSLNGYVFFENWWPDTVVKASLTGNPLYLYASKVGTKAVSIVKHDCFWRK